jgi:hypothetical protein
LQRGNGAQLFIKVGVNTVGNAQAANEQGGESNKDQRCGNLVQPLGDSLTALGEGCDFPSGVRECLLELLKPGVEILLGPHPVFVIHTATRSD